MDEVRDSSEEEGTFELGLWSRARFGLVDGGLEWREGNPARGNHMCKGMKVCKEFYEIGGWSGMSRTKCDRDHVINYIYLKIMDVPLP